MRVTCFQLQTVKFSEPVAIRTSKTMGENLDGDGVENQVRNRARFYVTVFLQKRLYPVVATEVFLEGLRNTLPYGSSALSRLLVNAEAWNETMIQYTVHGPQDLAVNTVLSSCALLVVRTSFVYPLSTRE